MKPPLVSVLMPTLNSAAFIREALHSLAEQTYRRFELVVVDGGSRDATLDIVSEYADDGNVVVINAEPGKGLAHDLNLGLKQCRGSYIARFDADDVAMPERLSEQVNFLSRLSDVQISGGGAELFWDQSGVNHAPMWHHHIRDEYLVNNPFFHPTIMLRRGLVDEGLFRYNEDFLADEDYELWGRLVPRVVCANLPKVLIRYRLHGGNSQRDPWKYRFKEQALRQFCQAENIYTPELVTALAEFQCSSFITPDIYKVFTDYAHAAVLSEKRGDSRMMPKLGWLQWALMRHRSYSNFMEWYTAIKNWRV